MIESRPLRWGILILIGAVAAIFASFNSGERVALNLGFATIYQLPLVALIFAAFVAGMATMFLLGLRHDLRVRRALQDAGFGDPQAPGHEPTTRASQMSPLSGREFDDRPADGLPHGTPAQPLERPPP